MPTNDNTLFVRAMKPGETRWVSWGAILRIQTRDAQDQVRAVHDEVALSLAAIGTRVKQPNYEVQVTRNSEGYKVYLNSGELDFVQSLRHDADLHNYAIAEVLPR